jgi:predicted site-specific integrase-resolvase
VAITVEEASKVRAALYGRVSSEEQRNRLTSQLFEVVWIANHQIVAVTPRSEFKPFFGLEYQGCRKL